MYKNNVKTLCQEKERNKRLKIHIKNVSQKPEKNNYNKCYYFMKKIKYVYPMKQEIKRKLRPQKAEIAICDGYM